MRQCVGEQRADEHGTSDPLGREPCELELVLRAGGEAHHHRPLGAGCVHQRQAVAGDFRGCVALGVTAAIGAPVAEAVHRKHPEVAREVRDLHLPVPGVNQPRREQEQGVLALAVDLIEDALTVALDETFAVGIARAALLAGAPIDASATPGAAAVRVAVLMSVVAFMPVIVFMSFPPPVR